MLYSFRDTARTHKEDYGWLHKAHKNGEFRNVQYMEDWLSFGTIILESNLDMEPLDAYRTYGCRWEIELVMRYYKQTCEFDETRIHDDYSVIGSDKMTYKKLLRILSRAKKVRMITMNPSQIEIVNVNEKVYHLTF